MKKYVITIVMFLFTFVGIVYAGDVSFYLSKEMQQDMYDIIMKDSSMNKFLNDYKLVVVKESIAPVYVSNLLDYARTGQFDIEQMKDYEHEEKNDYKNITGNVYLAKVVFSTNDEYSGSIVFSIEDGKTNLLWFNSAREFDILYNTEAATNTTKYLDYYDNIESFEKVFSSKEDYSIDKTKYVIIKGAGEGFLIGDGVEAIFVSPKTVYYGELIEPKVLSVKKDLREMAQNDLNKYYMLKEEYEKWHKEHPDEKWDVDGYFPYELDFIDESKSLVSNEERNDISVISDDNENKVLDTDDISENKNKTDIVEKITTKEELVTNSQKDISEEKKTPQNSFGVIIVIGLAFVFFISVIVMYKKKQRKQ